MNDFLDKNSPLPLYFQLKNIIKEKIENGELKPNDRIESERELEEKYNISRPTIRQALKELVNEGLLYREKGKGTFVAKPKIDYGFIQKFTTFYEDMEIKGYKTKTKVLDKNIVKCRKTLADKLKVKLNSKIIKITRIRYIEDEPIVLVINHIPYDVCKRIINDSLEDESLYRIMAEKYGVKPYKAEISLEPTIADNFDSRMLEIKQGSPVHLMKNITYTEKNVVMDYFESHLKGDKGKVKVELYNEI
ncbi:MAG: GntR family transcriptional regulator [Bacillota bacterium]